MSFMIFPFYSEAQNQTITAPLKLTTTDIPFHLGAACFTSITYSDRSKFQGIPSSLNDSNSIISTVNFGSRSNIKDSIYILIGDKNENERICIIDANNNHNFSDDHQYSFNTKDITTHSDFQSVPIHFKYPYEGEYIDRVLYMKPNFYRGGLHFSNPLSNKYFVTLYLTECRIGQFKFKEKSYKIAAVMPTPRPLYDKETSFSIVKNNAAFPPSSYSLKFRKRNKKIYVGSLVFKVDSITPMGDSIYISYMGKKQTKQVGYLKGFYAPDISAKTINGTKFSLYDCRGKFVLIDFWGTWCNPCIHTIPTLRKIHKKYKDLIMVSIACEKASLDSLKRATKKYKMNWHNIYKSDTGVFNIIDKFNIRSFPTTFLINPQGRIIFRSSGSDSKALIKKLKRVSN